MDENQSPVITPQEVDIQDAMKNWRAKKISSKLGSQMSSFSSENLVPEYQDSNKDFEIPLTDGDKMKLIQLKQFKQFKWYTIKRHLNRGDCFGEAAFQTVKNDKQNAYLRDERIKTTERTGVAVLNKADYFKVLRKAEDKHEINKSLLFKNVPFLEKLDRISLRYLSEKSVEENFSINNYVFK